MRKRKRTDHNPSYTMELLMYAQLGFFSPLRPRKRVVHQQLAPKKKIKTRKLNAHVASNKIKRIQERRKTNAQARRLLSHSGLSSSNHSTHNKDKDIQTLRGRKKMRVKRAKKQSRR